MQVLATFTYKGCAFVVLEDGTIWRIKPDPVHGLECSKITSIPWNAWE